MIKKEPDARYMQYDQRNGEILISTSIFDDMYWDQQNYNAIMRSSINQHFKNILIEKGYKIDINKDVSGYKINSKKLKEIVKDNKDDTIERILNDTDNS